MNKTIKRLVVFQLLILILACLSPFTHPHKIRQVDTMGVSFMYWLKLSENPAKLESYLPSLLSAGDLTGISPMEFPILNLLMSPVFIFGIEYGRVLALFGILCIAVFLIYKNVNIWKSKTFLDFDVSASLWLLPLIGVSQRYMGKFMPDLIAFLLVLLSIGYSWPSKPKYLKSFVLGTLGLLMKPPVVVAYSMYFVIEKKYWKNQLMWIIPAIIITVLYYKLGLSFLREHADTGVGYFLTEFRNPIHSLIDFFSYPSKIAKLFFSDIFSPFIFPFIAWVSFKHEKRKDLIKIWGLFILSFLVVAALDGKHAFIHDYYFVGTMAFIAVLTKVTLEYFKSNKVIISLFILLLAGNTLEKGIYKNRLILKENLWKQCSSLNNYLPFKDVKKIRSANSVIPKMGLCTGKIQNSKVAMFGVYLKDEYSNMQETLSNHSVVKKTKDLILVKF